MGTVIVLDEELLVVEPKPFNPAVDPEFFFFFFVFDFAFRQEGDIFPEIS